ncbi:hypothetical protein L208DRAFT_1246078, partial [Tricholoma matsutake]
DALNGCLCRSVLDSTMDGVLNCKQAGCETQWYHLWCVKLEQEPQNWVCAACCKHLLGRDEGGNGHKDDVILLNIDMFLII